MRVVCLANSYKHQGRCIAGIDQLSGEWIRPISNLDDGRIPVDSSLIKVEEISILDIVDIPFNSSAIRTGHEIENCSYTDSPWQIIGKANSSDLLRHCEHELLYSDYGRVIPFDYFRQLSPVRTLQLIEVKSLCCYKNDSSKWKGVIADKKYDFSNFELSITDPIALEKLNEGEFLSPHCLLCMSLSQPFIPFNPNAQFCYRLIAGIIEFLPEIEMILMEMNKASWSIEQGRKYLQETFGKISRYQLTEAEAKIFLKYLKNLV